MTVHGLAIALRRIAALTALPVVVATTLVAAPPAVAAIVCGDLGGTAVGTDATTGRTICQVSFTSVGTTTWTVPSTVTLIQAVSVGGGGGGGMSSGGRTAAGGGGGGGVSGGQVTVSPGQNYTVSVGAGGSSTGAGSTSQITGSGGTVIAGGGAAGGSSSTDSGASGGMSGYGYSGGSYSVTPVSGWYPYIGSGGGGGASGNGSSGWSNNGTATGGAGGAGLTPSSLGQSWFANASSAYGGGGGGGAFGSGGTASGGAGRDGGGSGGCYRWVDYCGSASSGTTYGGGGGGAAMDANGGTVYGGSGYRGLVLIRFLLPSPPDAPTISSVSPVTGSTSALDVAFTLGSSSLAYTDVLYSLDGGSTVSMGRTTSGTYRITGLSPGVSYAVRVFGVSSAGTSAASSAVSQSPYAVPPSFTATAGISGNVWVGQSLSVTATATGSPTPALAYQWYGCDASHSTGVALPSGCSALSGATSASYTVQSGDFGSFLLARVEASNSGGGVTTTTDSFSATTLAVIRPPAAPAVDSVTATSTTAIDVVATLSVDTGGSAITGVDYSTNNGADWAATGGTSGTFSVSGLSSGTTYQVKVRARNAAGAGSASTATSVTTFAGPVITSSATVSGTAAQGRALTGADAAFSGVPTPTLTRAWYACTSSHSTAGTSLPVDCVAIAGQTTTSLTLGAAQVGDYVLYSTTGTNAVTSAVSYSATSGPVIGQAGAPTLVSVSAASTSSLSVVATLGSTGGQVTDVEYSLDSGAWTSSGQTTGSFTVTGLTAGTSYSVRVRMVNDAGASGASNSIAQSPLAVAPSFTAGASLSGSAQVGATLTASATVTGTPAPALTYQWYSCDAAQSAGVTLPSGCSALSGETASTTTVAAAQYNARLLVRVRATNAGGGSTNTVDSYSATTSLVIDAPAAPGITATDAVSTPGQIDLTVTAPDAHGSAITGYQYSLNPGAGTPTWTDITLSGSTATITSLANGTAYDVSIRAINAVGAGPGSSTVTVTPLAAPTSIVGNRSDGAIDVTWQAPTGGGATGYRVQVRTDPAGVWADAAGGCAPATTQATTARSCTANGLTNGVAYNLRVAAVNAGGRGQYSAASAAVTPLSRVDTLAGLTVSVGEASGGAFTAMALSPTFDSGTLAYTLVVANPIAFAIVTPTQTEAGEAIFVDGVAVASGTDSAELPLAVGTTTITVTVHSADRVAHADSTFEKDYVITVSRASAGGGTGGTVTPTPPRELGPRTPDGFVAVPGSFVVTEDGRPVVVEVGAGPTNDSLDVRGTGWGLSLGGRTPSGNPVPLGPSGILRLLVGASLYASGSGFEPNSWIRMYLMSDPVLLGSFLTDGSGSFSGAVAVPPGTETGTHVVQLNGYTRDGSVRSFSLGIEVVRPVAVTRSIGTRVYFDYGSARLSKAAKASLRALVAQVPATGAPETLVVGVRRDSGATASDRALARQRARVTAAFLRAQGLEGAMAMTVRPVTVKGTAEDRRVSVTIAFS